MKSQTAGFQGSISECPVPREYLIGPVWRESDEGMQSGAIRASSESDEMVKGIQKEHWGRWIEEQRTR